METPQTPRITHAERMNGGVIIMFDDGKCAIYSASLIDATFSQAEEVPYEPEVDDLPPLDRFA
jgi:hypothetical protein